MGDFRSIAIFLSVLCSFSLVAGRGALPREGAAEKILELKDGVSSYVSSVRTGIETVGHRAGSFKEFPKKLDGKAQTGGLKDVNDLMDRSFQEFELDGIEVDVQLLKGEVYLCHDPLNFSKLSSLDKEYLQRNRLIDLLQHYLHMNYDLDNKKLFIEIKTELNSNFKHPELSSQDERLVDEASNKIIEFLKSIDHPEKFLKNIRFVSFNHYAIERVFNNFNKFGYQVDTIQIVTTNKFFLKPLVNIFGIGSFNKYLIKKIQSADWLTGVWFDINWVRSYGKVLNKINSKRKKKLVYGFSIYNNEEEKLYKKLDKEADKELLENVFSIVFDFLP